MKYQMLAIDLDGTLLGADGQVSAANRAAVLRAVEAGLRVVPCTGRAWRESRRFLRPLIHAMPVGVFVTGSVLNETESGRALDVIGFDPDLAHRVIRSLYDLPDAVLVFRESSLAGHDYLVTGDGAVTANTRWWFEATDVTVHHQPDPGPEHLDHILRIGLVAGVESLKQASERLGNGLTGQIYWHHFAAIPVPAPDGPLHVLEVFPEGIDKWMGLQRLAARWGIEPTAIATIGDEINDVSMVRHAGCGIAMANAHPKTLEAARYTTRSCDEDGVAHAIDRILAGDW